MPFLSLLVLSACDVFQGLQREDMGQGEALPHSYTLYPGRS